MLHGQDSFLVHVKFENVYGNLPEDVEITFDTSNYEVNRPLPIGKNKKLMGPMKDELGGKIMKEIVALGPKMYSYLMDDDHVDKKAKGAKKYVIKRELKFEDYKTCLENNKTILKTQ